MVEAVVVVVVCKQGTAITDPSTIHLESETLARRLWGASRSILACCFPVAAWCCQKEREAVLVTLLWAIVCRHRSTKAYNLFVCWLVA